MQYKLCCACRSKDDSEEREMRFEASDDDGARKRAHEIVAELQTSQDLAAKEDYDRYGGFHYRLLLLERIDRVEMRPYEITTVVRIRQT